MLSYILTRKYLYVLVFIGIYIRTRYRQVYKFTRDKTHQFRSSFPLHIQPVTHVHKYTLTNICTSMRSQCLQAHNTFTKHKCFQKKYTETRIVMQVSISSDHMHTPLYTHTLSYDYTRAILMFRRSTNYTDKLLKHT